jgi:hypothetical protein
MSRSNWALAIGSGIDEGMLQSAVTTELRLLAERGAEVRNEACGA